MLCFGDHFGVLEVVCGIAGDILVSGGGFGCVGLIPAHAATDQGPLPHYYHWWSYMRDISASWGATSWMFGYAIGYTSISVAPTSAGARRVLSMGGTVATVEKLVAAGATVHTHQLVICEILFTPVGWMIVDTCTKGPFASA